MTLPSYERVLFGKSPLRLVIGQVRFPLLFRFNEKPFLAPFQEAIQPEYPRPTQEQQAGVKITPKGVEPTGESLWRFSDRESNWSVVLGEGALTLESRRFTSIEDFIGRFEKLLNAANTHLGVEERSRLGLRFINEMRSHGATTLKDWAALLNPDFAGFTGADLLPGPVEHAFHEIRSKPENGTLVIRHGVLTGTSVMHAAETASPQGPFYLIDIDYFDDRESRLDLEETIKTLRAYNDAIYQFFRWAVDGKIYKQLEPRSAAR